MGALAGFLGGGLAWLLKFLLGAASGPILDKVLGHLQATRASEVERLKVTAGVDVEAIRGSVAVSSQAAETIRAGMQHPAFWRVWSIFGYALGIWFAAIVLDSLNPVVLAQGILAGDLSRYHVDALPPSVQALVQAITSSLFFGGATVAGASIAAGVIGRALSRK